MITSEQTILMYECLKWIAAQPWDMLHSCVYLRCAGVVAPLPYRDTAKYLGYRATLPLAARTTRGVSCMIIVDWTAHRTTHNTKNVEVSLWSCEVDKDNGRVWGNLWKCTSGKDLRQTPPGREYYWKNTPDSQKLWPALSQLIPQYFRANIATDLTHPLRIGRARIPAVAADCDALLGIIAAAKVVIPHGEEPALGGRKLTLSK